MAGLMTHSAADIVRYALIDQALGVAPGSTPWPIFAFQEPDTPDNVITVYDTEGRKQGRRQVDGEIVEHEGVQIRVRAARVRTGTTKANAIARSLDVDIYRTGVTVESSTYTIQAITRVSGPMFIGEDPNSNLKLFTINAVVSVRQNS